MGPCIDILNRTKIPSFPSGLNAQCAVLHSDRLAVGTEWRCLDTYLFISMLCVAPMKIGFFVISLQCDARLLKTELHLVAHGNRFCAKAHLMLFEHRIHPLNPAFEFRPVAPVCRRPQTFTHGQKTRKNLGIQGLFIGNMLRPHIAFASDDQLLFPLRKTFWNRFKGIDLLQVYGTQVVIEIRMRGGRHDGPMPGTDGFNSTFHAPP